ncbi:MAG TPA: Mur ligase family protein, partial [Bacteroidales bacterium]|nr:Mur ligase family protein [Bacteroidales bacterium]
MRVQDIYTVFIKHPFICTDSRKSVKGAVFFALRGPSFDGNAFAREALDRGCAFAVVDDPTVVQNDRFILVKDSLAALQELAGFHRSHFQIPVLAITGTNGKTTTKELCHAVLSKKFNLVATPGNLNNHIGVPLTVLSIAEHTEMAVVEMGANHPGEISTL